VSTFGLLPYARAQIPPSAEAVRQQQQFKDIVVPQTEPLNAPAATGLPLQNAPAGAEDIKFVLNGVTITGLTVYQQTQLESLYADKIGQEVNLVFLFDLANAITVKYRNDGYILSRAIVPQQEIRDGIASLEVVEGYVSNVVINGAEDLKTREHIQSIANNITRYRPVNITDIERYLLLIRDMAGHNVDSLLRPAAEGVGAADLVLQVTYDEFQAGASLDNYGTKFLGPLQGTLRVQGNSMLRAGDRTVARYIGTDTMVPWQQQELRYFDVSHSTPLNDQGTMATISGSHVISYPGNSLDPLDAKSKSDIVSLELSHPVIRSRQTNLFTGLQFNMIHAENKLVGTTIADDRLRVLRGNAVFDHVDNWNGITQVVGEISKGLDIFGASNTSSPELSRARGESSFLKFNIDVGRLQKIYNNINLYIAGRGQFTRDRLLSAEEFGLGGSTFGRGYDSSEITGDRGYAGKLELQYNGTVSAPYLKDYQAFLFYDAGKVFQSDNKAGLDSSIASVGGGVRFNVNDGVSGALTVTRPLTKGVDANQGEKDLRAYFSVSVRY
jgi:hemolysin activation/secretion protein